MVQEARLIMSVSPPPGVAYDFYTFCFELVGDGLGMDLNKDVWITILYNIYTDPQELWQ